MLSDAEIRAEIQNIIPSTNLESILRDNLVPAEFESHHSGESDSEIYIVEGYPDAVVRKTERLFQNLDEVRQVSELYRGLSAYGINPLPYLPVEHEEEVYVITKRVNGVSLDEALKTPSRGLIDDVDVIWGGLAKLMSDATKSNGSYPYDITQSYQYMYGRTANEDKDRILLVDLGVDIINTSDPFENQEFYNLGLKIRQLEKLTGIKFTRSRSALEEALTDLPADIDFNKKVQEATRSLLASAVEVVKL